MVHFITSQVFDREINFTMAAHAQRSLDTAVGGLGFTSYLHAVEECARSLRSLQMCVCKCVFASDGPVFVFAPAHRIGAKRAVRQPLTGSDRGETHRREVAALESDSDGALLPWIQDSHQLKPAQSGSNLMQVNCKIATTHG